MRALARRRDLLRLAPLPALAIAAALLVPLLGGGSQPSLAASTGPRMALTVTGPGVVCSAPPDAVCSAPVSSTVIVTVDVAARPAAGYVGFQTELFYDDLTYQPRGLDQEILWPQSALPARFPASPAGNERIVDHGALSGVAPPLPVSTHTGGIVEVLLGCPAQTQVFTLALVPYDALSRPLGSGFKPAGSGGEPGPSVPVKTTGQRAIDLDGDGSPEQVDVAGAVQLTCGEGTPVATNTPTPSRTPTPTNTPAPSRTPTPTTTPTRTSTPTVTPTPSGLVGDVSCDGEVNSIDAVLLLQYVARIIEALSCQELADTSGDGNIDSVDAALVLQFDAGLIDSLPP